MDATMRRFRIVPGGDLDRALNVLVAVQAGEPAPPGPVMGHDDAVDIVEAARTRTGVMAALGMRALMVHEIPCDGVRPVGADDLEATWFGGLAG